MKSTFLSRIAYVAAFSSLAVACSSTDSTTDAANGGGSGGASAGSGGTTAAGAGGTSAAGAGGTSAAGAGGTSAAGAGGTSTAGAGGTSTAGSGGSATAGSGGTGTGGTGTGGTGGGGGTARKIRLANLVVGFKAMPIDVCVAPGGTTDWTTVKPVFAGMGDDGQFFSPTVSVWFNISTASSSLDFRFVAAMSSDCGTPVSGKISDYTATIPDGEYHTMALIGDTGSGGSTKALQLVDIKHPAADSAGATWTVFNGLVNGGTMGADFGTYDKTSKAFSAEITAVAYGKAQDKITGTGTATTAFRRTDSSLVLAAGAADVTDAAGTLRSLFATGTNENAATGSNNLPWLITCDDGNVKGQSAHPLVADCDYVQGPQFGVKLAERSLDGPGQRSRLPGLRRLICARPRGRRHAWRSDRGRAGGRGRHWARASPRNACADSRPLPAGSRSTCSSRRGRAPPPARRSDALAASGSRPRLDRLAPALRRLRAGWRRSYREARARRSSPRIRGTR